MNTVECPVCWRTVSKKKTKATDIVKAPVFNKSCKRSIRSGEDLPRDPSIRVVNVRRICRDVAGCMAERKRVVALQKEEAAKKALAELDAKKAVNA